MRCFLLALALLASPVQAGVPGVVTDIAPVQSIAAQVMGDLGEPVMLLNPDADPHDFQMRPSQGRAMANAELVIWMGRALTPWMGEAIDTLGNGETASLELLALPDLPSLFGTEAGFPPPQDPATADPHAWLDPANAARFTGEIAEALAALDPENAPVYRANAARFQARLTRMTDELRALLQPAGGTALITYHDAYRYFMSRFGLQFAGSLAPSDAVPPSAARIAEIRDFLAANPAACVFTEPGANLRLIQAVLPDPGAPVASLGPLDAGQPPGPGYYEALIRRLADTFAACAIR